MKYNILLTIISLLGFNDAYSQIFKQFDFKGNNLFGLEYIAKDTTKAAIKCLFYDLDADGDQDAIIVGIDKIDSVKNLTFINIHFFIEIQENMGDRWHPSFATRKPFMNQFPFPKGYFFPAIGDLNHDKMPDFIVSSGVDSSFNLQTLYYERKAMTGTNQFNIIGTDSLKLNWFSAGSFMVPDLADMDMDGDLDILMSGFLSERDSLGKRVEKPTFLYAKNIGTITKPEFLGWYPNPYGLADAINNNKQDQLSTIGDIDNDGDNDILSLTTYDTFTVLIYLQNNRLPNGKPNFDKFLSLIGLPVAGKKESLFSPSLVDIDGDGDLDVFIAQSLESSENYGIGFYENLICAKALDNSISQTGGILKASLSGVKYQWYDCSLGADIAGATAQSFKPAKNGKYAVKLDNNTGCDNISLCYNFILSATDDQLLANQIRIFPNPSNGYIEIINDSDYQVSNLTFTNSLGQIVKIVNSGLQEPIQTSEFTDGLYTLEITIGPLKVQKTLIILNKRN